MIIKFRGKIELIKQHLFSSLFWHVAKPFIFSIFVFYNQSVHAMYPVIIKFFIKIELIE